MPITPKLCITYESDGSWITIKDETKAYVLDYNLTGYGAPNTERVDLAGVLQIYYQPYEGDRSLVARIIDYNIGYLNTQETSHQVNYGNDGWYTYVYTLVNTTTSPNLPAAVEGSIVYNIPTDDLRQYDGNLDLQVISDYDVLEDGALYELVIVESLVTTKLRNEKSSLSIAYFDCKQCIECGCDEELKNIQHMDQGIRSAEAQFNIAKYEAQRMIERLTKQYKT